MVLNSLKILNLKECYRLHSIHNLNRLPNLKTLILRGCFYLQMLNICETIRGLKNLAVLDLSRIYLKEGSWVDWVTRKELLFPLPDSLEILYLEFCKVDGTRFGFDALHTRPLHYISLAGSLFEFLPRNIDLTKVVVLDLSFCVNLKFLVCLPSTLKELCTRACLNLEKITFQSPRFKLQNYVYDYCPKLSEVQGLFKLVPVSELDELDLGDMQWIKVYQDHEVELMYRNVNEGRSCSIQMLYEYGIRSTYLKGIEDQSMTKSEYTSSSDSLSFRVPSCPKNRRIQGLNVTIVYRSDSPDTSAGYLFLIMNNKTKDLSWCYNPWVYCKPGVDEDVVWLSYWPMGDVLDPGDEIEVSFALMDGIGTGCGVNLVYSYADCEIKRENNAKEEEVIGGDLSEFEVVTGGYMLCRDDQLSDIPVAEFFDNKSTPLIQVWTKYLSANDSSFEERKPPTNPRRKELWLGGFTSETEIPKIKKGVSRLVGVENVKYYTKTKRLLVYGHVHPATVLKCVREFDEMTEIVDTVYWSDEEYEASWFWSWFFLHVFAVIAIFIHLYNYLHKCSNVQTTYCVRLQALGEMMGIQRGKYSR